MSLRGYWRTLSERMDCRPAITMTKLTTIERTGRFMKRSVNFISSCPRLAIFGLGSGTISRLDFVIDLDGGSVAQLEHARCHHFIAGIQPGNDRNLISARSLDLDELLLDAAVSLALGILNIGDDEDRVTIRGIVDGRGRQGDDRAVCTHGQLHLNKHSGTQLTVRIGEGGLYLDIPGGLVDFRVNRRDTAGEYFILNVFRGEAQLPADMDVDGCLLGHADVHINRIERLVGNDRTAGGQVLSQVHLSDAEDTGERRANCLSRNRSPDLRHIWFGGLLLGRSLVVFRP